MRPVTPSIRRRTRAGAVSPERRAGAASILRAGPAAPRLVCLGIVASVGVVGALSPAPAGPDTAPAGRTWATVADLPPPITGGPGTGEPGWISIADMPLVPIDDATVGTSAPAATPGSEAAPADGGPAAGPVTGGESAMGIPAPLMAAYRNAERLVAASDPACHLPWWLLAGIGKIESAHARGGRVDATGRTNGEILGPRLDGSTPNTAVIGDSDGGRLDGDPSYDRAVGPMQFLPGTWRGWASDGNADGVADPHNVNDAALAAGRYLCAGDTDLSRPADLNAAIMRYNPSQAYVRSVLAWGYGYRDGAQSVPAQPGPVDTGPTPPPEGTLPPPPSARPPATPPGETPTPRPSPTRPPTDPPTPGDPDPTPEDPDPTPTDPTPTDSPDPDPDPDPTGTPDPDPDPTETPDPDPTGTPDPDPTPTESTDPTPTDPTPGGEPGLAPVTAPAPGLPGFAG